MTNRIPDIYLFNPTCEYAIANGNENWNPNLLLLKMESDLATLQLFIANKNDIVLTTQIPSEPFTESLHQLNIEVPDFVNIKSASNRSILVQQKKNKLLPWGWSPAAHKKLADFKFNCSYEFENSPVFNWEVPHRDLYSKKFAMGVLGQILDKFPCRHFIPQHKLTELVTTKSEIEDLIEKWDQIMVKAPWSSSGRGLQPIRRTPVHPKVWEKILAMIKEQGYAIVEPYHNKEIDLAFQFQLKYGKIKFLGFSNFSTDYKGQYNGNSLNGLPKFLNSETAEFVNFIPSKIINPLIEIIESTDLAKYYEGYFGVDSLIIRNEKNELEINPCLEINVRQNMGLISLQLEKYIIPEKKALFRTYYKPEVSFFQFAQGMEKKHPLKVVNQKIESGFFPLTDRSESTLFGAYLLV